MDKKTLSVILMIAGAISALYGCISMLAIDMYSQPHLLVYGIIAFIIGIAMFSTELKKKNPYKIQVNTPVVTKNCPDCGTVLNQNQNFCHNCGRKQ